MRVSVHCMDAAAAPDPIARSVAGLSGGQPFVEAGADRTAGPTVCERGATASRERVEGAVPCQDARTSPAPDAAAAAAAIQGERARAVGRGEPPCDQSDIYAGDGHQ